MRKLIFTLFVIIAFIVIFAVIYSKFFYQKKPLSVMDISTITDISKIVSTERFNKDFIACLKQQNSLGYKIFLKIKNAEQIKIIETLSSDDLTEIDKAMNKCQSNN